MVSLRTVIGGDILEFSWSQAPGLTTNTIKKDKTEYLRIQNTVGGTLPALWVMELKKLCDWGPKALCEIAPILFARRRRRDVHSSQKLVWAPALQWCSIEKTDGTHRLYFLWGFNMLFLSKSFFSSLPTDKSSISHQSSDIILYETLYNLHSHSSLIFSFKVNTSFFLALSLIAYTWLSDSRWWTRWG